MTLNLPNWQTVD